MTRDRNRNNKNGQNNCNDKENVKEVAPGTIEVAARIMGDDGKWIEQTVQLNSGITVGSFDVSSRNGYLASFNTLEQTMIQARNEASRRATEQYLEIVGKKQMY